MSLIYKKIADVMRDLDAIDKDRRNTQQGYDFRGIDDVYNALHPILAKHGVFTAPEVLEERTEDRTSKSGSVLIYRVLKIKFRFYCEDASWVEATVIGEGMDSGDKASNKAMAVAHKYALIQVFSIPTKESKDPENESHSIKPARKSPEIKSASKAPGHQAEHMPFGQQEEIYGALPHQKVMLQKDAKALGITDTVSLQHISAMCVDRGVFVQNLRAAVKEWMDDHRGKMA